ncbi:HNH endonuclease [Photorhabdus heterorhabditis]|uniref:HNH endonuclease n=1 Tax=Photorhabdus heterorhabditis TaxID=880156 RepID=UPI001562612C|nr:HNH endonuclease [Photorhabdus heterorhabditis]NRN27897.1 HNH endonuclease [Photorhabdus heterorhabditis subsp. aluminescens]
MSGNVVRYPNFSPYERQRVDGNHSRTGNGDFAKADAAAPKGKANYDLNTWHHHENGKTMQEVPKKIHRPFTHRGGV